MFALPQYLKEHQYTHTNQQPFVCGVDDCLESFRQRGKLSLHRRTHEVFKKKDYRILHQDGALGKTPESIENESLLHKRSSREAEMTSKAFKKEALTVFSTVESEEQAAKILAEDWQPLKRKKLQEQSFQVSQTL